MSIGWNFARAAGPAARRFSTVEVKERRPRWRQREGDDHASICNAYNAEVDQADTEHSNPSKMLATPM